MTRETKVGLLVGLGVILLVGIFLTDHLAMSPDLTPLLDIAPETQEGLLPELIDESYIEYTPADDGNLVTTVEERQLHPAPKQTLAIEPSRESRERLTTMEHGPSTTIHSTEDDVPRTPHPATVRDLSSHESSASTDPPLVTRHAGNPGDTGKMIYYVKVGDSLYSIAQREYGSGELWTLIKDANPKVVRPNGGIREGVRLVIPARPVPALPMRLQTTGNLPTPTQTKEAPSRTDRKPTVYTVRPGDTLWLIAKREYGDSGRLHEIFEANRDRLKQKNQIIVGQELRLPR